MKYNIENNINNFYENYDCIIIESYIDNNSSQEEFLKKNNFIEIKKKYKFEGKINTHLLINNYKSNYINDILIIGCGKKKKINTEKFNKILKYTIQLIKNNKYKKILFSLNNIYIKNLKWKISKTINYFEENNYFFDKFKKEKNKKKNIYINFLIKKKYNNIKNTIKEQKIISNGIKKSKNLCNTPANICNSEYIYNKVKKNINNKNIFISCLKEKDIKKLKMYSYLSVGKGSKNPPLITIIKYNGDKNNNKPIVFIGKGVTFDSGGLSIKTCNNMWEMKYDMSGASVIYGLMYIISKLNIKLNIIGILACSENMIDKNSTRPGDVVKTLSKKTIEIINTDAEGRLLLCDVLTYAKKFNPMYVIDIATLTGACVIALGDKISGLFSNNKELSKIIIKSGKTTKDYIWELPLFKKYNKLLHSKTADIKNCSDNSYGGAITAACFLSNFTKSYKWAHIDIAGTAYNEKGSTGRPINLLFQLIKNIKKINNLN